jgi:hypothetical protein
MKLEMAFGLDILNLGWSVSSFWGELSLSLKKVKLYWSLLL